MSVGLVCDIIKNRIIRNYFQKNVLVAILFKKYKYLLISGLINSKIVFFFSVNFNKNLKLSLWTPLLILLNVVNGSNISASSVKLNGAPDLPIMYMYREFDICLCERICSFSNRSQILINK